MNLRSSTIILVDGPRPYQANLYTNPCSGIGVETKEATRVRNPEPWNILLQTPTLIYHPL